MKIMIQGLPEFRFTLTRAQIVLLMSLSRRHYDGVCRDASASGPDGFIRTWFLCMEHGDTDYQHRATWRQLDTCLKIMEVLIVCTPEERATAWDLTRAFNVAMNVARDRMPSWSAEV